MTKNAKIVKSYFKSQRLTHVFDKIESAEKKGDLEKAAVLAAQSGLIGNMLDITKKMDIEHKIGFYEKLATKYGITFPGELKHLAKKAEKEGEYSPGYIGYVYALAGDSKNAVRLAEKALDEKEMIYETLGDVLSEQKKYSEAIEMYELGDKEDKANDVYSKMGFFEKRQFKKKREKEISKD